MDTTDAPQVPVPPHKDRFREFFRSRNGVIATAALIAIIIYLILHFAFRLEGLFASWPLVVKHWRRRRRNALRPPCTRWPGAPRRTSPSWRFAWVRSWWCCPTILNAARVPFTKKELRDF